jgi:hypothetical protein
MAQEIATVFADTWVGLLSMLKDLMPKLISLIILILVGCVLGYLMQRLSHLIMRLSRFDTLLERSGIADLIAKTSRLKIQILIGRLIFWAIFLTFFLKGMEYLGFDAARMLVADLLRLVPNILLALGILIFGYSLTNFVWRAVLLWAANAHIQHAPVLGAMVRGLLLIATFAMALEQINVGQQILQTTFAILFGGIVLSLSLAFGLGGRHLARRFLSELIPDKKSKTQADPTSTSHL